MPPDSSSGPSRLDRARCEVVDVACDGPEPLLVRVAHHRREESLVVQVDGDREVDLVVEHDRIPGDRRVHVGELVQRVHDRSGDERQVGEREALLGSERRTQLPADPFDAFVVDLHRGDGVRRQRLGGDHRVAGEAADVVEALEAVTGTWRHRCDRRGRTTRRGLGSARGSRSRRSRRSRAARARVDHVEDVLAGDATTDAATGDRRGVELVLLDQPPDQRRQQRAASGRRGGRRRGSRRRSRRRPARSGRRRSRRPVDRS